MKFGKLFRTIGPVVAMAAAAGLAGCQNAEISFNGEEGVPLEELDMSGAAPTELALLGPDRVVLTEGPALAITVEGDNADTLRFVLDDGSLAILREKNSWSGSAATVNVTMPAPAEITVAGSGAVFAPTLATKAETSIAGSGKLEVESVEADSLEITIAGSGSMSIASGTVRDLEVSILGSGDADLANVKADRAEVSIAGSGDTVFTSDGEVEVSIMGSGDVTVRGNAKCTVDAMGSGKVTCERAEAADAHPAPAA